MKPERSYYWFVMLTQFALGISATAYLVFQRSIGLTNAEIFFVEVVYSVALLLCEVPTGMLADGKGRAWSLAIGAFLWAGSTAAVAFAQGFWSVLPAFVGIGVSNAFISGALEAWLKDAMAAEGRDNQYTLVLSRGAVRGALAVLIGGVVGAASLLIHARLQWVVAGMVIFIAGLVVVSRMRGIGEPFHRMKETEALRAGLHVLRRSFPLRWAMCAVLLFPFYWVVYLQWSPSVFQEGGFWWLSVVWAVSCAGAIVGGWAVRRFVGREPIVIVGVLALIGVMLLGLSASPLWAMPFLLFGWRLARAIFDPMLTAFTQHRIESGYRATFGSFQSLLSRVAATLIFLFMGLRSLGQDYGVAIEVVYLTAGTALLIGTVLLALFARRATQRT